MENQQDARIKQRYQSGCVLGLSITQLTIGILCILAQITLIAFLSPLAFVGHGIWTGIIFIITGSFGIASSRTKTKCTVVTFLVMSIISAVFAFVLLIPSASGWALVNSVVAGCGYNCRVNYSGYLQVVIVPAAIMVFLAVLEGVLAIISSGLACHALCGGNDQQQTPVIAGQVQYVTGPNGQQTAVIMPIGQQPQGYMPNMPAYNPGYGPPAK